MINRAAGDDVRAGGGIDSLQDGEGIGAILRGAGPVFALGGAGDDRLNGGAGSGLLTGGERRDILGCRGQHGNDVIRDVSAEDELHIMRSMNGLTGLDAAALSERMVERGADTWLDLGEDNSILFLAIDSASLSPILETNLHCI